MKETFVPPEERETLSAWQIVGIVMHDLYGLTWKDVVSKIRNGRGATTLSKAYVSPAGIRLRERIAELVGNPERLAKLIFEAQAVNVAADLLLALEWAKEARDHRAVHNIAKDVLALAGLTETKQHNVVPVVHLHIDHTSLEPPTVDTTYEVIEEEDKRG